MNTLLEVKYFPLGRFHRMSVSNEVVTWISGVGLFTFVGGRGSGFYFCINRGGSYEILHKRLYTLVSVGFQMRVFSLHEKLKNF